ncbi:o-succinylbenzoate--CoA ligase [Microbacterium halophytorum]|uniref:o-succinylbenzoate--CoA ligase n=1 Tax=Microbacterium halophytorum TaxID=2067568 RepID=UPI000CFCED34|nr:o-succinylbenzoate--CoA ligase [Microbacterium halophytorum]
MYNAGIGAWATKRRLKDPEKEALIFGERVFTYRQFADAVDQVAEVLHVRDITRGDRVAYLGENSPEFLFALFACAQIGAVFVPINTRLAPPEITHVLTDSGSRALIYDIEFAERVAPGVAASDVVHVIPTHDGLPGTPGLNELMERSRGGRVAEAMNLDEPAAIIYTSGTTGKPKGAVLTHQNLTYVAINAVVDYGIDAGDRALLISPLFHVAALGMGALPIVMVGGTIVLEKRFDAGRALALIEQYGISSISGVPTTYQLLADHPDWSAADLSTLRKLTCGGSAVPTRILNAYEERGMSFSQGYGMTETSPGATHLPPQWTREKQGSVGLPHFFTNVRVTNDAGEIVPRGTVGEIEIQGPNVFAGYHGQPEKTAESFRPGGWFRSGDMGYLDEDGFLFIADRLKDMIISGGENIYPAEVENLINDIDGVTGAAVIGVPDDKWGEVPCAIVTLREGTSLTSEQVVEALTGEIARYKIPRTTHVIDEFPRTASGKIRKADLRARFTGSARPTHPIGTKEPWTTETIRVPKKSVLKRPKQ